MSRIIIQNDSEMDDVSAIYYALRVVKEGRVSNFGRQYCFATTFKSGVTVYADRTKTGTDKFIVMDRK